MSGRMTVVLIVVVTMLYPAATISRSVQPALATAQTTGSSLDITSVTLFEATVLGEWRPPAEATLTLSRWRWGQGARVFLPAGYYPAGIHLSLVLTGTLVIHVDGPLRVGRATAGEAPGPLETVANGTAVTLNQGDVFAFPTASTVHGRNARQVETIVLTTLLLAPGAIGEVPNARTDAVSVDILAGLDEAAWADVPQGPVTISATRTLISPGAELEPYVVSRDAPQLLVVEAGLLELWTDTDFDRVADSWEPVIPSTAFTDYVVLTPDRVIRASEAAPPPSAENGFATLAPGPLLILTLDIVVSP